MSSNILLLEFSVFSKFILLYFLCLRPPMGIMFFRLFVPECFRVCVRCRARILLARYLTNQLMEFHKLWLIMQLTGQMHWLDFEGRLVKIVTARSDIWVRNCSGRKHPRRRLGLKISSSSFLFFSFIGLYCYLFCRWYKDEHITLYWPMKLGGNNWSL